MSTTFKPLYGSNNQALTITLASLAASPTVGRESTAVDNGAGLFLDALVFLLVEVGTLSGNKQVLLYAYGTADGGTNYTEGCTGSDAAHTRQDPTILRPLAIIATPTNSVIYRAGPFSIAAAFGGIMPEKWGIVVFNDTGAAFSATAGNNKAFYQGQQVQGV
jgi:hypothetical protein